MNSIDAPALTTTWSLKEWAVAVEALRAGDGLITVRKGGIREEAREFRVEHTSFALFPTYEHQQSGQLQPRFAQRLEMVQASAPPPGIVRIDTWAEVIDAIEVRDAEQVRRLEDFYVFSTAYALERLQWRPKKALHVLLLRIYRLAMPLQLDLLAGYGGCKSWISLATPVPLDRAHPALDDATFAARRAAAWAALG